LPKHFALPPRAGSDAAIVKWSRIHHDPPD
jgi:hypothetical protein